MREHFLRSGLASASAFDRVHAPIGIGIAALVAARAASGSSLVVPRVPGGRRGHPVLVGLDHRDEILTGCSEQGLRGLLAAHPDQVSEVPWTDQAGLADMDTPADYAQLLARLAPPPDGG